MAAGSFEGHYVWHPAADDRELARACTDVRAGRYLGAHNVLQEARGDYELRAHRSLVLASEAADSDLAERWLAEEPGPEAALLAARVAMIRALRIGRRGDARADALLRIAQAACVRAARLLPQDPTPWVAQLALARIDGPRDAAPRGLLTAPPGPWQMFAHVLRLDPWHREAHHRFLACFFTRNGGSASARWDVASFLSHRAPATSALRLLPARRTGRGLRSERAARRPAPGNSRNGPPTALGIYHNWFPQTASYRFTPVLDLAYLAHALFMAKREFEAREVLTAMGPYASRMPWSVFGDPGEQLTRARKSCGLPTPAPT